MTNRILFSHAYLLQLDPKQWATGQPYAPLGTLYAASFVREKGYAVSLFDPMFQRDVSGVMDAIKSFSPDVLVICEDGFNYLTKMCLTNMREAAFQMIRMAKDRGCTVIISGSDATDHFEAYLEKGADFILIGEVEQGLFELLEALNEPTPDFTLLPGLAFKQQNGTCKTVGRKVTKELDSLPMPAWDLMDMEPYRQTWLKSSGYFSMNMATTRGCPYKCNWCAKPIYGNRYNSRSTENVISEIRFLKSAYGIDHIWFCDDIFGLKPGWVEAFAKKVREENLIFRFKIQARADLLVGENYVQSLALAGCENVWMGAESGSQKILDAMDKGIRVDQIEQATKLLKKAGIKASFFLQFGYPGETRSDIDSTIQMVNRLLPHSIGISVSYPLPGTIFYEKVKAELTLKTNWTDSNDLALLFKHNYPPDFYRQLHTYVHKSHRLHLAKHQLLKWFTRPLSNNLVAIKKTLSILYYLPMAYWAKHRLEKLSKSTLTDAN